MCRTGIAHDGGPSASEERVQGPPANRKRRSKYKRFLCRVRSHSYARIYPIKPILIIQATLLDPSTVVTLLISPS